MNMISLNEVKARMQQMGCMVFGAAVTEVGYLVKIATCVRLSDMTVFDLAYDPDHPEQVQGYYLKIPPPHVVAGVLEAVTVAKAEGVPLNNEGGFSQIGETGGDSECRCERCKAKRAASPAVQAAIAGIESLK